MTRLPIVLLIAAFAVPEPAAAFWRRSQVSFCSDAATQAERTRHRCWELDPYMDSGWPALGLGAGSVVAPYDGGRWQTPSPPRKGITRRLG